MTGARVRVLHSMPAPKDQTRFSTQLRDGAPADLDVLFFSWDVALRGDYDVFHAHWPEYLLRGGSALGRWRKRLRFARLLAHLKRAGIPVVRTLHNLDPHEAGGRVESALLSQLLDQTTAFVRLNPVTIPPLDRPTTTILHGHYKDQFAAYPKQDRSPGRILNFGLIRPYKNVPALIEAFNAVAEPGFDLRIVGKPADEIIRAEVSKLVNESSAVSARLTFVDDDELVSEVTAAEVVILPYAEMHNSGTLLVALSLARPVILPWSEVNEAISREVGEGWVFMYRGGFSIEVLEEGLQWLRARDDELAEPNLLSRDWPFVGQQHLQLYRTILTGESTS